MIVLPPRAILSSCRFLSIDSFVLVKHAPLEDDGGLDEFLGDRKERHPLLPHRKVAARLLRFGATLLHEGGRAWISSVKSLMVVVLGRVKYSAAAISRITIKKVGACDSRPIEGPRALKLSGLLETDSSGKFFEKYRFASALILFLWCRGSRTACCGWRGC